MEIDPVSVAGRAHVFVSFPALATMDLKRRVITPNPVREDNGIAWPEVRKNGSERESDGTATFTQLSSPAEPRGTDVGHRHPLGRGHRGRDWFGRDAEGAG